MTDDEPFYPDDFPFDLIDDFWDDIDDARERRLEEMERETLAMQRWAEQDLEERDA